MSQLENSDKYILGVVKSVDTSTVIVSVDDSDKLKGLQVNHIVSINSIKDKIFLIGLVSKIVCTPDGTVDFANEITWDNSHNLIKISLIGTYYISDIPSECQFRRSLAMVPTIGAECHLLIGEYLKKFMQNISSVVLDDDSIPLQIGSYSLDDDTPAYLNGNKLFQRHAMIVGSTGSGKSWCVAKILEQIAQLDSADAIIFDIHGEYGSLYGKGFSHFKIAGPGDKMKKDTLFVPYWLLNYEETLTLILERTDTNAPNQAMVFSDAVMDAKREYLEKISETQMIKSFTIDSPIPYSIFDVLYKLQTLDTEMVEGARGAKQGPLFGKLTRLNQRLESKINNRRLNFMFGGGEDALNDEYFGKLCRTLMSPSLDGKGGIKVIDFSEVPSDILPLVISLLARIVFSIQQWSEDSKRHPIALFCDEAHLYIPARAERAMDRTSLDTFERISKEGRKYGVSLVVISQRPSEVNRTVLSQSNNFIAMRLTNADDQNVVKRLFPDSLGDYSEILPILDIGEAIIVGDASALPSRVKITPPEMKPKSATIDFWDVWKKAEAEYDLETAIKAMRRQSKV